MASRPEFGGDSGRHAFLQPQDAVVEEKAGRIQGLLNVHAVVDPVGQHIGLAYGLVLTTHDAEAQHRIVASIDHGGNEGVQRPFAAFQPVEMIVLQHETAAPVLQIDARIARHQAATEGMEHGIDQGTGVAVFVHHGEIHGVFVVGQGGAHGLIHGPGPVDAPELIGGECPAQQSVYRQVVEPHVRHEPVPLGHGQGKGFAE